MSRKNAPSLLDEALELFKLTPLWVGPVVALGAFLLIRYLIPMFMPVAAPGKVDPGIILRPLVPVFAWLVAAILIIAWLAAEFWKLTNRRLFTRQRRRDSIRSLSWQHFERLVAEAYRRQGFVAEVTGSTSNDGGVDIILHRDGQRTLVQCKHWRAWKVGVPAVRELLGVVTSQHAARGILVTSGRFTPEARAFAAANPQLELIEGQDLAAMIQQVQTQRTPASKLSPSPPHPPACPQCGSPMLRRTARSGPNPGSQFWGCPRYPACNGTRP